MTAIDLRASTMQILDQFDKADASLWQKVLDAVTSIYKSEEDALHVKRAQQKIKIRQMVGILNEENLDDWKREKETVLSHNNKDSGFAKMEVSDSRTSSQNMNKCIV